MDNTRIEQLTRSHPGWEAVERMFGEMYEGMARQGLRLPLAVGGAERWRKGIAPGLGRFVVVVAAVAVEDGVETVIGFGHGVLRLSPDYQGSRKVGLIAHLYVSPEARQRNVGRKLVAALESWFYERKVHSIELQVLCRNQVAIAFWRKLGFGDELLQMRKLPAEPDTAPSTTRLER